MEGMTQISRMMYERAKDPMSISEATKMLEEGAKFRTFADKLLAFSKGRDVRALLTEGLLRNHPEAKRDAVDKKVRNWLNGRTQTVSRKDAFELAFILGLSMQEADRFLSMVTEEGIHWRDREELVLGFALINGLDFAKAEALLGRMPQLEKDDSKVYTKTSFIYEEVMTLHTEAQLADFLRQYGPQLGKFHNTAYAVFMDYMSTLENAGIPDGLVEADKMTVREILDSYLYRKSVPAGGKKDALTEAQKAIRADWPDETTLSRMKSRQIDVTRKVLVLLFLATNGGDAEEDYDFDDDEELTRDEIFADSVIRLNRMLQECGYMKLDPRNRFDWMTMYAMCAEDIFDVDERFGGFLSALFNA